MNTMESKARYRRLHALARVARASASRGVTLIEILIVLAIVGLIAGGVAVVAVPKLGEARVSTAKNDARTIHPVAEKYRIDHPGDQCPTVELLREKKELSQTSNILDPWGKPYKILCGEEDIMVHSAGPDVLENTKDDIRIPETAAAKQ